MSNAETQSLEFAGKIVVLTGAALGIGAAAARRFAAAGALLVLTDRDVDVDKRGSETHAARANPLKLSRNPRQKYLP